MDNWHKEKRGASEKHIPTPKEEVTTLVVCSPVQRLGHSFSPEEVAYEVDNLGIQEFEGF